MVIVNGWGGIDVLTKLVVAVALSIVFGVGVFFNAHADSSRPPVCGSGVNRRQCIWLEEWLAEHKSEPGYDVGLKGENTWERDMLNPPNTPY